jgi:hypothetical protein
MKIWLFYNHLLAKAFYDEEKLLEIKEFFYCFVISEYLQEDFQDFELILEDLNEIPNSVNSASVKMWIFQKIMMSMYKSKNIEEFQDFLKKLLVFGLRTGFKIDCFYEAAGSFGSALVLKMVLNCRTPDEIINILEKLQILSGVKILQESFFAPVITGITSKIILFQHHFPENLSEKIKEFKEKILKLLPEDSNLNLSTFENISRPVLYKITKKERISEISFEKLEEGRLVSFFSSSRFRLTWQIFHSSSDFRFESFLVKKYEFSDPGIEEKIEAEVREAEVFKGINGFSQMVFKEKIKVADSFVYRIGFSFARVVEKREITEKLLNEILDKFLFFYRKKMKARLIDPELIFVNEKEQFVISDFGLVNFKFSPGYQSRVYDVFGDFCELPRVSKKGLRVIFRIVEELTVHLNPESQSRIKSRLLLKPSS